MISARVGRKKISTGQPEVQPVQPVADPPWLTAVRAAEAKKATDIRVLDLREVTAFADYFVICTGASARQLQAICDEVGLKLKQRGEAPSNLEGYGNAEWILADYGDYLVHIFSEKARAFYDLERLWRQAKEVPVPPPDAP